MSKIDVGGIKVLPTTPNKNTEITTNVPVSTYKSHNNVEIEKRMKQLVLTNQVSTTIDPNISIKLKVNFTNKFDYIPFVIHSLICNDELFDIQSHIAEITESYFILKIENSALVAREFSISYTAR